MTVLVLNCGSSSIKYEVFEEISTRTGSPLDALSSLSSGLIEVVTDHTAALRQVNEHIARSGLTADLEVVGHRVVHGGEAFTSPTLITAHVIDMLHRLSPLAPLHNPPSLEGIRSARELRPDLPHVAVFDTAFHSSLGPAAYRYAVPNAWYRDHGVRRYGFHGTSHDYVSRRAATALGEPMDKLKLISLHLGNGASACAIDGGRSVDTSMGLSPLQGLVMGTRSGDLDPAVVFHMLRRGESADAVERALNRQSGLLGLAGDSDMRVVQDAAAAGNLDAITAIDVVAHRVRGYVGAYLAHLGGLDAVIFTGGIGEHSARIREAVIAPLGHLGLSLDASANESVDAAMGPVSIGDGEVAIFVIATDEARMIAAEALGVLLDR